MNPSHKLAILAGAIAVFSVTSYLSLTDRPNVETTKNRVVYVPSFEADSLATTDVLTEKLFAEHDLQILNVWASWCGVCKREHDELLSLSRAGVPIIGLNYRDQSHAAQEYLAREGNPYAKVIFDPKGELGIDLGIIGTPETYLIDQEGQILIKYRGEINKDKWNAIFSKFFDISI
ncbi:DsbE family thiol:disulfide interchange protein [Vibrio rotiferianus]|uniref:DsbE family thiol:disulfide interchange protein n=1 Tax=Vibrio rotiferianus TaxID=190895 RepID=UPI00289415FC|nr:Putative thiol:disulfide oxidoreductase, nitrite reductase complex assembly [Vibrio rotiferianus]CAH1578168.1 Putative thiol:disulfide oxidoreductase, nitrite reductase complex assembly [Vibrio rotiferianus]